MMFLRRHNRGERPAPTSKPLLFVFGVMISVFLPDILIAAVSGPLSFPFVVLFVCWNFGAILGFAFYVIKVRSFQQQETFRLLKTQHKEFFQQVRLNVARLLKKGRCDDKLLPGRS
jgi:hypothetical protein